METDKPGLTSAPLHTSSVAAQTKRRMDVQAPTPAVYVQTVPALPVHTYFPAPPVSRGPVRLPLPPLYFKETLPLLTLHIVGGLQSQSGLSGTAAAPPSRSKSAGKHMCPHCGRDCLKPSVLEKHVRCHTGERPYPCTTCGVSFKTQSNLYKHKRTQAHARLSSESEQSSLDSVFSSRETCSSSLSLDECSKESGGSENDAGDVTCSVASKGDGGSCAAQTADSAPATKEQRPDSERTHVPLQRQEAALSYSGKSRRYESTDSGFSESSDPSTGLPEPGGELPEADAGPSGQKDGVREQRALEERISRLISENTAVVEDKQLENVRPRKTVLSKQGSIDLPLPYTFKDSFHFDMRVSKNKNPGLYRSEPTQRSSSTDHAPFTRSNSLPFSVTLLQPESSSVASSAAALSGGTLEPKRSPGYISPTGVTAAQPPSSHRPLVRQAAVDCNHAADALFTSLSVEDAGPSSLSSDGELNNRKSRKKKAQKFAYNKWYMYGGGTFQRLYQPERAADGGKGRKSSTNPEAAQGLQRTSSLCKKTETTCASSSTAASSNHSLSHSSQLQSSSSSAGALGSRPPHVPSDRKKQKTEDVVSSNMVTPPPLAPRVTPQPTNHPPPQTAGAPFPSVTANVPPVAVSAPPTSFLPKYQLKLPNTAESDWRPPPHVVNRSTCSDGATSSDSDAVPTPHPLDGGVTSVPPHAVTTDCRAEGQRVTPEDGAFAGAAVTAMCQHDSGVAVMELGGAPGNTLTSAPPPTGLSSPGPPVLPGHAVPCDPAQPAGQKVFHVHTADLHICLQIISDEQLALIEPQIERHGEQEGGQTSQTVTVETLDRKRSDLHCDGDADSADCKCVSFQSRRTDTETPSSVTSAAALPTCVSPRGRRPAEDQRTDLLKRCVDKRKLLVTSPSAATVNLICTGSDVMGKSESEADHTCLTTVCKDHVTRQESVCCDDPLTPASSSSSSAHNRKHTSQPVKPSADAHSPTSQFTASCDVVEKRSVHRTVSSCPPPPGPTDGDSQRLLQTQGHRGTDHQCVGGEDQSDGGLADVTLAGEDEAPMPAGFFQNSWTHSQASQHPDPPLGPQTPAGVHADPPQGRQTTSGGSADPPQGPQTPSGGSADPPQGPQTPSGESVDPPQGGQLTLNVSADLQPACSRSQSVSCSLLETHVCYSSGDHRGNCSVTHHSAETPDDLMGHLSAQLEDSSAAAGSLSLPVCRQVSGGVTSRGRQDFSEDGSSDDEGKLVIELPGGD